jgi:UDP-glucose 4-epimerase
MPVQRLQTQGTQPARNRLHPTQEPAGRAFLTGDSGDLYSFDVPTRSFIAGGAGFIGSHLVRELLRRPGEEVVVFDNFVSGSTSHLEGLLDDPHLQVIEADLSVVETVVEAMRGVDHVYLLAANPDIAAAVEDPAIDFWHGTYLAHNVLEAARISSARRITYASGSGVYGDHGDQEVDERFGPLVPVSTYGASKLACEAMLAAYAHMFGIHAAVFRFANVVGARQTHGVTYDFVRHLIEDPTVLRILGDGSQSKSYIHVSDVISAMLTLTDSGWHGFEVFNVGTGDYVTVTEIADLVVERMGLASVRYEYTGGARGWKGDVPIVRFRSDKVASLGWRCHHSSLEALLVSIDANIMEALPEVHHERLGHAAACSWADRRTAQGNRCGRSSPIRGECAVDRCNHTP